MSLVNDKHQFFLLHLCNASCIRSRNDGCQVAHLLNGRNDQQVRSIVLQLCEQTVCVCGIFNIITVRKVSVIIISLFPKLITIHQENDLVNFTGGLDQLCAFKARHCFTAAGSVVHIAALLTFVVPVNSLYYLRIDFISSVILIAAHNFKDIIRSIRNCAVTNQSVRHRNGKKLFRNFFPVVNMLIVEVAPMKIVVGIESPFTSGVRKVQRFGRRHRNKHLNKREESRKYAVLHIFADLIARLFNRYRIVFELDMIQRHTVDQQHQIASAVAENFR